MFEMFENIDWKYIGPLCIFTIITLLVLVLIISYRFWSFYKYTKSHNGSVVVKKSSIPNAGDGVFSTKAIPNGEIIEICPLIIDDTENVKNGNLRDYMFDGYSFDEKGRLGNKVVMALGYGGMYNHSYSPNCKYTFDYINNRMLINAIRDIKPGEELFIFYGIPYWTTRSPSETNIEKNESLQQTVKIKGNGDSGRE